jgi:asparagine synthase (glutamine-hydrolysing)
MCGFGAEVRPAGAVDRTALAAMGDALAPRGPDGEGERVAGRVGLVHRRLAIIDLSERGAQPMHDPDTGLSIVFNGCIYN